MTLAILCSGQGPQHPNMFALTGDAPEAANLFVHAAALLDGRDPRLIVRTDPKAAIHQDRTGQILCTLQALAAAAALHDAWPHRRIIAGYSVGEVAAWSVAGLTDATTTLDLVSRRAEAMDAASRPGDGLLFVRGLSRDAVEDLCKCHDAAIAIINPDDAYVLGGPGKALDIIADQATKMGAAHVIRVAVNIASHTERLAAASLEFRKMLGQIPMKHAPDASARLFSGIDGLVVADIAAGRDKLAQQISHTVQWAACLEGCAEAGASAFLELGPGRALSEMAASSYRDIPARSLDEFRTLQGARAWLDSVVR